MKRICKNRIQFDDRQYVWAYGKHPKGRGTWAFEIEVSGSRKLSVFSYGKTLAEAKKEVTQFIMDNMTEEEVENDCWIYVEIMP